MGQLNSKYVLNHASADNSTAVQRKVPTEVGAEILSYLPQRCLYHVIALGIDSEPVLQMVASCEVFWSETCFDLYTLDAAKRRTWTLLTMRSAFLLASVPRGGSSPLLALPNFQNFTAAHLRDDIAGSKVLRKSISRLSATSMSCEDEPSWTAAIAQFIPLRSTLVELQLAGVRFIVDSLRMMKAAFAPTAAESTTLRRLQLIWCDFTPVPPAFDAGDDDPTIDRPPTTLLGTVAEFTTLEALNMDTCADDVSSSSSSTANGGNKLFASLKQLQTLRLTNNRWFDDEHLKDIAQLPSLTDLSLSGLELFDNTQGLGLASLAPLTSSTLKHLALHGDVCDSGILAAFPPERPPEEDQGQETTPVLETLELHSGSITDHSFMAVAQSTVAKSLRTLNVRYCPLIRGGAINADVGHNFKHLEDLTTPVKCNGNNMMALISNLPAPLKHLRFFCAKGSLSTFAPLSWAVFANLHTFQTAKDSHDETPLFMEWLDEQLMKRLDEVDDDEDTPRYDLCATQIQELRLGTVAEEYVGTLCCNIGNGIDTLAFPHVGRLVIEDASQLNDEWICSLATAFRHVQRLTLSSALQMTNVGLEYIADAMCNLEHLKLWQAPNISDEGLRLQVPRMSHLARLMVDGCQQVSDDCLEELAAKDPCLVVVGVTVI